MAARGLNIPNEVQKVLSPTAGDVTIAPAAGVIVLGTPTTVPALILNGTDLAGRLTTLDALVATRAAAGHAHALSDVTGLQAALDQKASADVIGPLAVDAAGIVTFPPVTLLGVTRQLVITPAYVGLVDGDGVPVIYFDRTGLYAPHVAVGGQNLADLLAAKADAAALSAYATTTALTAGLTTKAAAAHTHSIAQVTGLQGALDAKAAATHSHDASALTAGAADVAWDCGAYSLAAKATQITLTAAASGSSDPGGALYLTAGDNTSEDPSSNGGEIDLYAGNSAQGYGGNLYLVAGTGPQGEGSVDVRGGNIVLEGNSGETSVSINGSLEATGNLAAPSMTLGGSDLQASLNAKAGKAVANTFTAGQSILGSSDTVQLLIKGHATQNANLLEAQTSGGVKVLQVGVATLALGNAASIGTNYNANTIALGASAAASDNSTNSVLIGYQAKSLGDPAHYGSNVAVGAYAQTASGVYSGLAVGGNATVASHHGVALGSGAYCGSAYGFAIGESASAGGSTGQFALGRSAVSGPTGNGGFNYNIALGNSANCNSVACTCLGNFSKGLDAGYLHLNTGIAYTATAGGINFQTYAADNTGSSAPIRTPAYLDYGWSVGTDASRKGKLALGTRSLDIKKEALALSNDGDNPAIGFLGAAPVARPAALTAANGSACTSADAAVIANLRTRLGELESRLQTLGLLS